ncbi:Hint domain-containing protein [Archangium lansingense]|uniref:Hint domain-containing protein n=1 Tax=Archangium lansingense TaxID=2995310 RepID=A0ABT4ALU4_9BACT|nr:Hint domain-containing protein [Archangium lansinium]MCY1082655.1 Hint domain-containing protein [Archangium lansinium]
MRRPFLTLMMLAVLGVACSQQRQPTPLAQVDAQQLAEDSRVMARYYAQWQASLHAQALNSGNNERMPLDLNNEEHYRFVVNRLQASGLSPLNAPRLFLRLEELHRRVRLSERPMEVPAGAPLQAAGMQVTEEGALCGHMIPLHATGGDATHARFQGTGLTSCFGGSDYGYVDFNAYSTDEQQTLFELLTNESHEEYAGKVLETTPVSLSVERKEGRQLLVDSLAMAFNETTGEDQITYTSVTATLHLSGAGEMGLFLEHPRELLVESPDKAIRICLERGSIHGFLDCDYGSVRIHPDGTWQPFPGSGATGIVAVDAPASKATAIGGGTPTWIPDRTAYWAPTGGAFDTSRFQVAFRGTFFPHVIDGCQVTRVTSKVAAILMDTGGWCQAGSAPGTIVGKGELPWTAPTVPKEFPFDGILDFGTGNCLNSAQNVRLEVWAYAEGTCPDPWGGPPEPFLCPAKAEVKPVDYKKICMAEGTRVTRADGKSVPVEQVKVGEKLLANGQGLALTVTTVHRGGESKPLVKLRDEQGREVRVTDTHPLVTAARGVVQAGALKVGDAVLTRTGARKLVAVERVPYEGLVYNFSLGTPEELAHVGPEARTLYAEGFLVGDSQMQTELEKQKRVDARAVLVRLHSEWHQDFRLSQARHLSTRR